MTLILAFHCTRTSGGVPAQNERLKIADLQRQLEDPALLLSDSRDRATFANITRRPAAAPTNTHDGLTSDEAKSGLWIR
jgi:hypothetical protein